MKKEIEIEKWYRAKGTDTYFKTASEAEEYARTEYSKELLQQIILMYKNKKNCAKQIRQVRAMIEEAKSKTLDLREIVTYYCQEEIKKREVTIRACKSAIKTFSRDYDNLRGGISKC